MPDRRSPAAGINDRELPPALRSAVGAWRADADALDLAPAVLERLRLERPRPASPPPPPRWRQAAAALCAVALLIAAGLILLTTGEPDRMVAAVPPAVPVPRTVPSDPMSATTKQIAPSAVAVAPAARPRRMRVPAIPFAERLPAAREWLSTDRLADVWAAVPAPDPNRTWRDELRDGVRPYRAGVSTAVDLFAQALPPPPRSL